MQQTQSILEPSHTEQLLAKLNLAIEEARLVKRLAAFKDDLRHIENQERQFLRVTYLNKEISRLESQLWALRNQPK